MNGYGKSSLLGAICWCLTGRFFRDDCEPCEPEKIKAYPAEGENTRQVERDDAQSLIDEDGNSSSASDPYWVEMQLFSENTNGETEEVWLKRHSDEGLSCSNDGEEWSAISSVVELGINVIDAELHLLMPAKVAHLKFGKNPDLVHLLAEIVGYGNLETIAEVAESLGSNARRAATNIKNRELKPEETKIAEYIEQIKCLVNEDIKQLASYNKICETSRNSDDIEEFGKTIIERIVVAKKELAHDLGIDVPEEGTDEDKEWQEKSKNLPGQVSNLLSELEKPLGEIFPNSIGFETPPVKVLEAMEEELKVFEERTKNEIEERLAWAKKERENAKAGLMLKAAEHFPEGSNDCPVCTQELDSVQDVKSELEQLRTLSSKDHLQKDIEDHERSLIGRLDVIVSPENRMVGEKSFGTRLQDDWIELKKVQCKDLLLAVAERFDDGVMLVAAEVQEVTMELFRIPSEYEDQFSGAFSNYGEALRKAKQYMELCKSTSSNREAASEELKYLLKESKADSEADAFKEILERGRATNEELKALDNIQLKTTELGKSAIKVDELMDKIENLTEIANNSDSIKALKTSVRKEVIELVEGEVGAQTKSYYEHLYDNEVLEYEKLTTGHAANPSIKNEINLYLRAGKHIVPMGPYSNAGRMRALFLSFAFALLDRSSGSLGMLILDDPALSLDDEHKVRFVDNLVESAVNNKQVILGTHYETFFDDCTPVFQDGIQLKMLPRRRACDQVEFEASNLLARVQEALDNNSGNWREVGGNLRIWIEKILATMSGYCPAPFIVFNNLPQSIDNYAGITDADIATPERDTIIQALRCRHVNRIRHKLHHNEPVNRPDVEDALRMLQQCRKSVEKEIRRFKGLYQHALLGRGRGEGTGVVLTIYQFRRNVINENLEVVREAAAAHNAQGIEWDLNDEDTLEGYPVVLLRSRVIAPIALPGQYLVLDWEDREPESKDLVVVETNDGKRYVRRIWIKEDKTILLEATNPTKPYEPIRIVGGNCRVRRIVGVLYDNVQIPLGGEGEEWVPRNLCDGWFDRVVGVRVYGTSLEPVARNGQTVLVEKNDLRENILNDMLACVTVRNEGDFIKRCYLKNSQCFLCAVNTTEREEPIVSDMEEVQTVYPLKGVLFEVGLGSSAE
jgi:recombinational DNA repair ATPase RecF